LNNRKEYLNSLIQFINANAVLEKVRYLVYDVVSCEFNFFSQFSRTSLQQLLFDAEKMNAAHQLWLHYNDLFT